MYNTSPYHTLLMQHTPHPLSPPPLTTPFNTPSQHPFSLTLSPPPLTTPSQCPLSRGPAAHGGSFGGGAPVLGQLHRGRAGGGGGVPHIYDHTHTAQHNTLFITTLFSIVEEQVGVDTTYMYDHTHTTHIPPPHTHTYPHNTTQHNTTPCSKQHNSMEEQVGVGVDTTYIYDHAHTHNTTPCSKQQNSMEEQVGAGATAEIIYHIPRTHDLTLLI